MPALSQQGPRPPVVVDHATGVFVLQEFDRYDLARARVAMLDSTVAELEGQKRKLLAEQARLTGDSHRLAGLLLAVDAKLGATREQLALAQEDLEEARRTIRRLRWHKALLIAGGLAYVALKVFIL